MKNIFKSRVFTFILGAVIFSGITGVAAYNMLAKDIKYTPSDNSWKKANGDNITNVEEALDELYNKNDINQLFDNINSSFGGQGVSFSGFTVGHKYLAVYASNFWSYDVGENSARINSGAKDVKVLTGGCDVAERISGGSGSCAYLLTFTATAGNIAINYGGSPSYYSMKFIDITQ